MRIKSQQQISVGDMFRTHPYFPLPIPTELEAKLRQMGRFVWYPNPGNCGDALIAIATENVFKRLGLSYEIYNEDAAYPDGYRLVVGGGGGIVPEWGQLGKMTQLMLDPRIERGLVLPNSLHGCDELLRALATRYTVFCRERQSYDYCRQTAPGLDVCLAHDMAFYFSPEMLPEAASIFNALRPPSPLQTLTWLFHKEKRMYLQYLRRFHYKTKNRLRRHIASHGVTLGDNRTLYLFLRKDQEKQCGEPPVELQPKCMDISRYGGGKCRDYNLNAGRVFMLLEGISAADVVLTDRLHVSIAAAMLGKEVLMLDNSYGKLFGIYELSLQELPHVHRFSDIESALHYVVPAQ